MLKILIGAGIAVVISGVIVITFACLKAASDADDAAGNS